MSEVISVQVPTTVAEAMVMQDVAAAYLREHASFNDRVGFAEAAAHHAARRVEELEGALRKLEAACERVAAKRSKETYFAMLAECGADLLLEMDDARREARFALQSRDAHPPSGVTAPDGEVGGRAALHQEHSND